MNIRIRNLHKSFDKKSVLSNLSINFAEGSFNVILGENGSGKTTILETIAGITQQDSGHIYFDNTCVDSTPSFMRKCFYIPQNLHKYWALKNEKYYCFIPDICVEENLKMAMTKTSCDTTIFDILDMFDLYDAKDQMPNCLSFGLQQRLALARAFVSKPDVIMLDEPLSSLDVSSKAKMVTLINGIHKKNKMTVLYVTHDIAETEHFNALFYTIKNGIFSFDLDEIVLETESKKTIPPINNLQKEKKNCTTLPHPSIKAEHKKRVQKKYMQVEPIKDITDPITTLTPTIKKETKPSELIPAPPPRHYIKKTAFTLLFFVGLIIAKSCNLIFVLSQPLYFLKRKKKNSITPLPFPNDYGGDNIQTLLSSQSPYDEVRYYFDKDIKKIEEMKKKGTLDEAVRYAQELKKDLSGTKFEGELSLIIYKIKKEAMKINIIYEN